jgi:tetratricopeptide (TPR) repeat protein
MPLSRLLVSLLVLFTGALPALGQGRGGSRPSYSISGTVRDDGDQRPLEAVRVDLVKSTGETIGTTFTRGHGEFDFDGLGNGEYTVEVNLKGYEIFQQTVTLFNNSQRNVSVFLTRPVTVVTINPTATVSAHELSAPRKAREEFDKGLTLLYSKSDPRGAIPHFQRAIKEFPDFYEAYAQLGGAYFSAGNTKEGESALQKSIELSSGNYPDAFFLLAGQLNNSEKYSTAEPLARKGIALAASSWRGYYELARALIGLKMMDEAEKNAIQARDLNPQYPQVYLILANIHIERRDYVSLLQDLNGYLKLVPNGPQADQARKTRDQLEAAMRKAQEQSQPSPPPPSEQQ